MQLEYETLAFRIEKEQLVVTLLKLFETKIPLAEVREIGEFKLIDAHIIEFNYNKAELKFSYLLNKYFDQLKNKLTGNSVTYIHRNSGIPLIGNVAFGIVYRNSSIIEIKPITSCNLDCVYCSISEGLSSKNNDFVVEKDYLVEELEKLVGFVDEPVEIHIGVQGEPFLYADMTLLIEDLQKMSLVSAISIDTNGTLLNQEMLDKLAKNDKLQINFSLDAIDSDVAKKIVGVKGYNVEHVKKMITYASEKGIKLIVAPVMVSGINDDQMEKIIEFVSKLSNVTLGIQNYLSYKTGRNAGKSLPWDKFYTLLDEWEKKHDVKLKLQKEDFGVRKTKDLEKPFETGDSVVAVLKCSGRFLNSSIVVADGRSISVPCKFVKDKKVKLEIIRSKHNIFMGKLTART